jgi:hypothetical protein
MLQTVVIENFQIACVIFLRALPACPLQSGSIIAALSFLLFKNNACKVDPSWSFITSRRTGLRFLLSVCSLHHRLWEGEVENNHFLK